MIEKKREAMRAVCQRQQVELLILFGSQASGTDHPHSDMDLAVQAAKGTKLSKLHLIQDLESVFQLLQVDLTIITPHTDPLLLFEIFSNGRLLYERLAGLFEKNRLKAWHLYIDSVPLRQYEKTHNENRIRALSHAI